MQVDVFEKAESIIETVEGKVLLEQGVDFASLTEAELKKAKSGSEMVLNYLQVIAGIIAKKFVELPGPETDFCMLVQA